MFECWSKKSLSWMVNTVKVRCSQVSANRREHEESPLEKNQVERNAS